MRRRQGQHYGGDSGGGGHSYGVDAGSMQQNSKSPGSGYYQGEKDPRQWRWERENKLPQTAMSPHASFNEGQGHEAPRSYYQSQRPEGRVTVEKQLGIDPRSQSREEDMEIGYEDNRMPQTFEVLEQKFLDDIMKLSKEQTDAEDAEIARHRERINVINAQYQEQLIALRARHASRREEILRRESHTRQQQLAAMDHYPDSEMGSGDRRGYNAPLPSGEQTRAYSADRHDSYRGRGRGRFHGSARDHSYDPKHHHPGGRVYDTGSRYY